MNYTDPYVAPYIGPRTARSFAKLTEAIDVVVSDLEALHAGIVDGRIKASSLVEQMLGSSIETLRQAGA